MYHGQKKKLHVGSSNAMAPELERGLMEQSIFT